MPNINIARAALYAIDVHRQPAAKQVPDVSLRHGVREFVNFNHDALIITGPLF